MKKIKYALAILLPGAALFILLAITSSKKIDIPKTWDMEEIKRFHLHPPDRNVKVKYVPEEIYYNLKEFVLYKNYPFYVKEYEPENYQDSLASLAPEIAIDFSKLVTEEDWIKAGKLVFNMPASLTPANTPLFLDSAFINLTGLEMLPDGEYPYGRYVQTPEGLMRGILSCASCHTKVTEDGELIEGGQGDFIFDRQFGFIVEKFSIPIPPDPDGSVVFAPWVDYDERFKKWTSKDQELALKAIPPGVMVRQGGGVISPIAIPSLFGIKDIKYLDRTGLMKHENIGDMMRYAAFNQGLDMFNQYDNYIPMSGFESHEQITPEEEWSHPFGYANRRYSDEQLYALAKYVYSLEPPENPNKFSAELLERGEVIFAEQGCVTCHPPPLFTNNKLLPATSDFEIPEEDKEELDIFNISVETDPFLAMKTRRGTGYYKVPSLRGAWMREAFFHNGNLASVEDVLDPARLEESYVPTGFKPHDLETMAVKGHPFGLELNKEDKSALVAYIKSL